MSISLTTQDIETTLPNDAVSVVVDTTNGYAYFGASSAAKIAKIRLSDHAIIGTVDGAHSESWFKGKPAIDVTGGKAYFPSNLGISRLDLATFAFDGFLSLACTGGWVCAIDVTGGYLYAINIIGNSTARVKKISLSSFTESDSISLTGTPGSNVFNHRPVITGGKLYFFNNYSNSDIASITLSSFALNSEVTSFTGSKTCIATDGTYLFIGYLDDSYNRKLMRMPISSLAKTTDIITFTYSYGAPDTLQVDAVRGKLIVGLDNGYISKVDIATWAIDETISMGGDLAYPTDSAAINADGAIFAILGNTDTYAGYLEFVGETSPYERTISETLGFTDTVTGGVNGVSSFDNSASDALTFVETLRKGWAIPISDALAFADTVTKKWAIPVNELVAFQETLASKWKGKESIADGAQFLDFLSVARLFYKIISDGGAIADTVTKGLSLSVLDYLRYVETIVCTGRFKHSLADALATVDTAQRGFPKSISDGLALTDTSISTFILALVLSEGLTAADTVTRKYTANALILSGMNVADTLGSKAKLSDILNESFNLDLKIILDGETYQCWVLNTDDLHPSVYTNFNYSSFATLNGITYATTAAGVHKIDGNSAESIDTGVRVNFYNMGSHLGKRLHEAYFGLSGTTPMLRVITTAANGVDYNEQYYIVNGRAKVGKGVSGRDWTFELTHVDVVDFIEITPIVLSR